MRCKAQRYTSLTLLSLMFMRLLQLTPKAREKTRTVCSTWRNPSMPNSLAGCWLGVNSSIAKSAISIGSPGEKFTAGSHNCSMVFGNCDHGNLPSAQACDCSWHYDGTFTAVHIKFRMPCNSMQTSGMLASAQSST